MAATVKWKNLDFSRIAFSRDGKAFYCGSSLRIQTPRALLPYGISCFEDNHYSVAISMSKCPLFAQFLQNIDRIVKLEVKKNHFAAGFTKQISPLKNQANLAKSSIMFRHNQIIFHAFDQNGGIVSSSDVPNDCDAICLWEFRGIWFRGEEFGAKWICTQLKFYDSKKA